MRRCFPKIHPRRGAQDPYCLMGGDAIFRLEKGGLDLELPEVDLSHDTGEERER